MPGDALAEGCNHLGNHEKPPVACRDLDEVADQPPDPGALEDAGDRPRLLLGREDRAGDEALQVGAVLDQTSEIAEIAFDRRELVGIERQLEEGVCVAFRYRRYTRSFSQLSSILPRGL